MKKTLTAIAGLLLLQGAMAQVIRDHRKDKSPANTKTTPVTTYPEATLLIAPQVVLYEQANFSGQTKSFGVGNYRFYGPADFNDLASSMKVPNGLIAVIYEEANETGGYGGYIDLMEDCADLSQYNFNDKVSYLRVFSSTRPGFFYARNRMSNNEFVAGHWERERVNGVKPDNSLPAVASSLSAAGYPDDFTYAPLASQAEIDEFRDIQNNQMGVAVLGGETTQPLYYHHNQPGEAVYKYNKIIDPARLPGKIYDYLGEKLGWAGFVVKPLAIIDDISLDIKDWIFGSSSTKVKMDCWYPVSEFKTTVCGSMKDDVFICPQDYIHTQVTVDKDVCLELTPSDRFRSFLSNRYLGETFDHIEGEVKVKNLGNFNTQTGKTKETLDPHNSSLMEIKMNENVCLFGPWMADILDLNAKLPIPFTDSKIELVNIDLRNNNEIHPINQLWRRKGNELLLTAIVDETGYFERRGNNEVAASGLGQRMRFYIAFWLPANQPATQVTHEFTIDGVGFDFTDYPVSDIQPEFLAFKYNGATRLKVNDNTLIRYQKTHKVFFDKVGKRADGSVQGFIVVETEPIVKPGGSLNITVKQTSKSGVFNNEGVPVRNRQ